MRKTDILMVLLHDVFKHLSQPLVELVQSLNLFIEKDALKDTMSILDIRARTPGTDGGPH